MAEDDKSDRIERVNQILASGLVPHNTALGLMAEDVGHGTATTRYSLTRDEQAILGKSPAVEVPLKGLFIKKRQACIWHKGSGYLIKGYGGWRNVLINGSKVIVLGLEDHDDIRIGPNHFIFYDES